MVSAGCAFGWGHMGRTVAQGVRAPAGGCVRRHAPLGGATCAHGRCRVVWLGGGLLPVWVKVRFAWVEYFIVCPQNIKEVCTKCFLMPWVHAGSSQLGLHLVKALPFPGMVQILEVGFHKV